MTPSPFWPRAPKRIKTGGSGGSVHYGSGSGSGSNDDGSQLPAWALALIIIGAVWAAAYIFVLVLLCHRENSRKRANPGTPFRLGRVLWRSVEYTTPIGLVAWAVRRRWRRKKQQQQTAGAETKTKTKTKYGKVGGRKKVDRCGDDGDSSDDGGDEERRGLAGDGRGGGGVGGTGGGGNRYA